MDQSAPVSVAVGRASPGALLELLKPITWFPHVGVSVWLGICRTRLRHEWLGAPRRYDADRPLVCGASQVVNDWYDRHVDALNEPHRPIPSGRAPGNVALWFAMLWTLIAQTWALMLGPWVAAATFIGLLLVGLQRTTTEVEAEWLVGNSAVALSYEGLAWITGAAIVLGGALPPTPILVVHCSTALVRTAS